MGVGVTGGIAGPGDNTVGPIRAVVGEFDGVIQVRPSAFLSSNATLTFTRVAAGDYSMQKTAAAGTSNIVVSLSQALLGKWGTDPLVFSSNEGRIPMTTSNPIVAPATNGGPARSAGAASYYQAVPDKYPFGAGHYFRGFQVAEVDLIYSIGTANLTSLTPNFYRRTNTDNAAPTIVTNPGANLSGQYRINGTLGNTLPAAFRGTRYVSTIVFLAPYVIGNNLANCDDWLELVVVDPGTSVFAILGMSIKVNYNLL